MEDAKLKQYVEAAATALTEKVDPGQIAGALKEEGLNEEEVNTVMKMAESEAQNAGPETGAGADAIPLEQAIEYLDGLGIDPQTIIAVLQIVLKMQPEDVDKLVAMLMQAMQQGGQGQGPQDGSGPNPGQGQGVGGPPQGQPRYEV